MSESQLDDDDDDDDPNDETQSKNDETQSVPRVNTRIALTIEDDTIKQRDGLKIYKELKKLYKMEYESKLSVGYIMVNNQKMVYAGKSEAPKTNSYFHSLFGTIRHLLYNKLKEIIKVFGGLRDSGVT